MTAHVWPRKIILIPSPLPVVASRRGGRQGLPASQGLLTFISSCVVCLVALRECDDIAGLTDELYI